MLKRYQQFFEVSDSEIKTWITPAYRSRADIEIQTMEEFMKKLKANLKTVKKLLRAMIDSQQNKFDLEKEAITVLAKLEERTNVYTEGKSQKQLLTSAILNQEILKNVEKVGLSNPYCPILYFVRGEVKDINAMQEAIQSRQKLQQDYSKLSVKRDATKNKLDECLSGNMSLSLNTLKTMFKSTNEKALYSQELQQQINRINQDEAATEKILGIID